MTVDRPAASAHARKLRFLRRYWALAGLLIAGATLVYLLGNNLFPLVDRDEPRYAQASREMLSSGDWTVPTFLGEPRLKKPPLIYSLQATALHVWGDGSVFAVRLPSALAAVATLVAMVIAFPRIAGHRRALWAVFIFATALLPTYMAKVCMTDAVLHAFIAVAMLGLYAVWRGTARWPTYLLMGLAIGLSILTKGPPVFLFLGMTLLALWVLNQTTDDTRAGKSITLDVEHAVPFVFLRVATVLGLAAAVCVPWVIAFERSVPGGLAAMFAKEVVLRGTEAQEQHGGPPGYYAVTFWVTYFPWCLFWPAALVHGWKRRHLPWVRFSLAAVLGPWVFLEIYQTKLPHYWLPSYPYMALLTADVLIRGMRARIVDFRERGFLWGAAAFAAACGLAGLLVLVIPFLGQRPMMSGIATGFVLAAGFALLGWGALTLLKRRELDRAALTLGLGTWAVLVFATSVYWPATTALTLARRVGMTLVDLGATQPGDVMMIAFKEPSTAFYQGGTAREVSNRLGLRSMPPERLPRYLVVDADQLEGTDQRTGEQFMTAVEKMNWPIVRSFVGINLAKNIFQRQEVYILENRTPPATTAPSTQPQ